MIVIIDNASTSDAAAPPFDLSAFPAVLADRRLSTGRHLVLDDAGGPHRVWLRALRSDRPLAYTIPRDTAIDLRFAAVRRLEHRLSGVAAARTICGFQPTPFQRRRLGMLLDILNLVGHDPRPTTHEIARRVIYRCMTIGRGTDWKSSSERRRTQRLIDEAVALADGGYLRLLGQREQHSRF